VGGQVAGSLCSAEADLLGLLEQKGGAQAGAFAAVQPAQGGVSAGRRHSGWRGRVRQAQIREVGTHRLEAWQLAQARQQAIELDIVVQRIQRAMEAVLQAQEVTITLEALEGPRLHDQRVDTVVITAGAGFQLFAQRQLRGRRCWHCRCTGC